MRVFLDTNILLDALETSRERHRYGQAILGLAARGIIDAVVSAQSLVDLAYIYTKGSKVRLQELKTLFSRLDDILTIRDTSRRSLLLASNHFTDDFEDAVQSVIALDAACELIITSDKHFDEPLGLPVVSPDAFCQDYFKDNS